jgi:SAM-dependent methyltransferase
MVRRLHEEADFADRQYERWSDDLTINERFYQKYADPHEPWDWRQYGALLLGDVRGKRVLDLGCGMGEEAIYLARMGAIVTAIDIAPIGVALTRRRAAWNNLSGAVEVFRMRADPTDFPSASFDVVHGFGILHHIGLGPGLAETSRVLRPGGKALFFEHMGNSALVRRIQARCGGEHTAHEEPLQWNEIMAVSGFSRLTARPFHLSSRLRKRWRVMDTAVFKRLDHFLLTVCPPLQFLASGVVIYIEK